MERKTAHDFDQDLLILFDAYVHGIIDRRGFLDKAAKYAVGGVTAVMLLDQLSPKFVEAQVIKPEDTEVTALFAGASMLILLIGGVCSMLWLSRVP